MMERSPMHSHVPAREGGRRGLRRGWVGWEESLLLLSFSRNTIKNGGWHAEHDPPSYMSPLDGSAHKGGQDKGRRVHFLTVVPQLFLNICMCATGPHKIKGVETRGEGLVGTASREQEHEENDEDEDDDDEEEEKNKNKKGEEEDNKSERGDLQGGSDRACCCRPCCQCTRGSQSDRLDRWGWW